MLATFLISYEFQKGIISSGVLFIYWSLFSLFGAVSLRSNIIHMQNIEQVSLMSNDTRAIYARVGVSMS